MSMYMYTKQHEPIRMSMTTLVNLTYIFFILTLGILGPFQTTCLTWERVLLDPPYIVFNADHKFGFLVCICMYFNYLSKYVYTINICQILLP